MPRSPRLVKPFSVVEAPAAANVVSSATANPARLRPCAQCKQPRPPEDYPLNRGFGEHPRRSDVCIDCIRAAQVRRGRGKTPRPVVCPQCGKLFAAPPERLKDGGAKGRRCPQGHWTSDYRLLRFRATGADSGKRAAVEPSKPDPRRALRAFGFAGRIQQLELALKGLLAGYDKLLATLPAGSPASGLVQGSFGRVVTLSRALLAEGAT